MIRSERLRRASPWLAAATLTLLGGYRFGAVLRGLGSEFANFQALHGNQLLNEAADSRLNAWILAWVEHATTGASTVWNSNTFHPAENMLAGSEHLFGVLLQLVPVLPFLQFAHDASSAVALHQLALVVSSALLCATTYHGVRWATGSAWAAFLGAAATLMMPWRVSELSHLQLSSAQLLPVIWVLVVRGLCGEARIRHLLLLGVCTALQLLSSFYLAYFLTISCAVLVTVVAALVRPSWRDVARLAASVAPGFAAFGLSALPYLERQASADLASRYDPNFSLGIGGALAVIAPRWPYGWELLNAPANYWTPWAVVLLAVAGVVSAANLRGASEPGARRQHVLGTALAAIVLSSVVMMIGGSLDVLGAQLPMPAKWLGAILPGFSMLRGPSRWGILAAVALPMLAGLGAFAVDRLCRSRLSARGLVAAASAVTFAWFQIPTQPAWSRPNLIAQRYAVVRALPADGALLELPWPTGAGNIELGSRSVLSSTLHWRPVLNGYTGHRPRSYRFLQRIGARLPSLHALEQLHRLTHLRFVLLDTRALSRGELRSWSEAARDGRVEVIYSDAHTRIYEVAGWETGGELVADLISAEKRSTTFNGLARNPLELAENAGTLAGTVPRNQRLRNLNSMLLKVTNRSAKTWPGFDIDEEGLVRVRYTYVPVGDHGNNSADAREIVTSLAPIEVDFPADSTRRALVLMQSPRRPGEYDLCIDLVQQFAGLDDGFQRVLPLPLAPLRARVRVRGQVVDTGFSRMIDASFVLRAAPPACGTRN